MPGKLSSLVVLVTRAPEQSGGLRTLLEAEGASVHEVPVLTMTAVRDLAPVDAALSALPLGEYDGVILTSANAVAFWHERLLALGLDAGAARLFAIGPATARALVERGYAAPVVATEAVSEGLLATMRAELAEVAGKRFLMPRAREGRDVLIAGLRAAGARVEVVALYETRPLEDGPGLPAGRLDWVTFASPSAVRAFVGRFGKPTARVGVIGPVTAAAARELGLEVHAIAAEHTAEGLVQALCAAGG